MESECHFCRGIVLAHDDDIVLKEHANHRVAMHEQCARGHGYIEESPDSTDEPVEVTCPECGVVELL